MEVFFIGHRCVGKTALLLELANPNFYYVEVSQPSYDYLKNKLTLISTGELLPTGGLSATQNYNLRIEVKLPASTSNIYLNCIDTSGSLLENSSYFARERTNEWHHILKQVQQSKCIMLVLNPYQEILKPSVHDPENFQTTQQWCQSFNRYVVFLNRHCTQVQHILICLNKADLFCDLEEEARELDYNPFSSRKNWFQRNAYVTQKYFQPIQEQINQIDREIARLPVRCFITSIYNRSLLELPWIYLANYS